MKIKSIKTTAVSDKKGPVISKAGIKIINEQAILFKLICITFFPNLNLI